MVILTKDKCNCSNSNQCESHEQEQFLIYRKESDNRTNGERCKNGNEVWLRRITGRGLDEMHDTDILVCRPVMGMASMAGWAPGLSRRESG